MTTTAGRTTVSYRRRLLSGAKGNARLTALAGAILLVLLAVEGATIPWLGRLLSVHIFVGMLLLGPVALKLGSTGYRFVRYYTRSREYVEAGPPAPLMRVVVAPILVLSTLTLFGTGVALLAIPHHGLVLGLHKASFIVWFAACGIHVLAYFGRTFRELLEHRIGGEAARVTLAVSAITAGVAVAAATYRFASPWLDGRVHH
ncbi:MAG TPA: hypothetical protein VGL76_05700 [Gaiellaceae bacterium]